MKTVLKKFCGENQAPEKEVLDVNVLDQEGNPVDESTLSEEQIQFCAKVAAKAYRKFTANKRIKFAADEDSIDVVLPEDVSTADVDATVDGMVDDAVINQDPSEVVAEVEEEKDDVVPEVVENCGDDIQAFSAEDLREVEKLDEEIEKTVDNIPANEELDPKDTNESGAEGVGDIKEFAAKTINRIIGKDSVMSAKAKFFAAQRRK